MIYIICIKESVKGYSSLKIKLNYNKRTPVQIEQLPKLRLDFKKRVEPKLVYSTFFYDEQKHLKIYKQILLLIKVLTR